ncbi:something about silencing, SAS, complex subunit 4-domain-containing protein [Chaetomidium leptoderma]|uniref:Something about silencing, SAS, complex subunit 4-domain-containing protein n=1 Tax=Chaetomidium leptoderma TaxID=669021 RepID=A0AAN6VL85_9PEZI|nr:something about silencing, SAS, complex subunit 4-domain-containing protein [Chaetomidium leptoderma]
MAMTTSVTRSRRAESRHLPNPRIPNGRRPLANAKNTYAPRPKRQLDPSERDFDAIVAKKARFTTGIAVEIPARPSFHARFSHDGTADAKPAPPPVAPKPAIAAPNAPTSHRAPPANRPKPAPGSTLQQQQQQHSTLTKHQEKVANGLKHELNRLQPNAVDTKEQGRKLRSQEATRFKSELSAYFPEYDEVIGNDPKETHLLNVDTPIIITPADPPSPPSTTTTTDSSNPQQQQQQPPHHRPSTHPIRSHSDALYTDLFDAQRIDFSFLNKNNTTTNPNNSLPALLLATPDDPLPDSLFSPAHKKAERLERSIRNTEKGRAQHEKDQIIRLLDGLQGHDWLRVMGVSGITESKKRAFEPAREHFLRGCEGILGKFRRWAAEEKRRRLELAAERKGVVCGDGGSVGDEGEEEDEDEDGEGGEEEGVIDDDDDDGEFGGSSDAETLDGGGGEDDDGDDCGEEEEEGPDPEGEPPDDGDDVDASVAKQLREEALAAAAAKKKKLAAMIARGKLAALLPPRRASLLELELAESPPQLTSFFAKRYQREAALSKNRRRGRKVLAWGHPVPEMEEAEFELPAELRDEDRLRSHARARRRDKRLRK